jgi:hypothetical protein
MGHHGGSVCVVCSIVESYYSYVDKSMRGEFFVPAGTLKIARQNLMKHKRPGKLVRRNVDVYYHMLWNNGA